VQILTYPEAGTPPDLRRQVVSLQDQAWPSDDGNDDGRHDRLTHDPVLRPITMMLVDDERVLAALDILSKPIIHAGVIFQASGLSTVVVDASLRGHGHGHTLVAAAREAMDELAADLALFTCDRPLLPFYEHAGFDPLPGTVLVGGTPQDPFPSDRPGFDKVTVARMYSRHAKISHLQFVNTRIGLYSGQIDKLW